MSPIIYEPDAEPPRPHSQDLLKNIYGTNLVNGTIIKHEDIYYRFLVDHDCLESFFIRMTSLDIWWNRKRGRIK